MSHLSAGAFNKIVTIFLLTFSPLYNIIFMKREVMVMITMILFLVGYKFCKFLVFCSMLYILFSPSVMWVYLGIVLGYSIYRNIRKELVK